MADPFVFLSHSSVDKPFVNKLDAALSTNGLSVFLDERSIKVGDSIPRRIYEGIEQATHVIYIISKNSIQSRWVQEELDAAKMRQKESDKGCIILPIKIDDCELPGAVRHIKYADFVGWEDQNVFSRGLKQILNAIGVQLKGTNKNEIQFIARNYDLFREVETAGMGIYYTIIGALDGDWAASGTSGREDWVRGSGTRYAMKQLFVETDYYFDLFNKLKALILTEAGDLKNDDWMKSVVQTIDSLLETKGTPWRNFNEYKYCIQIRDLASRLGFIIRGKIQVLVNLLLSSFEFESKV